MPKIENHPSQTATFQAEWPRGLDPKFESTCKKVVKVAWNILSVILFPIGLARLAIWAIKKCAAHLILCKTDQSDQESGDRFLDKFSGKRLTLVSPTGTKLDACYIPGQFNKAVVFFPGMSNKWQHYGVELDSKGEKLLYGELIMQLFPQLGAHVLFVNSRWHTHQNPCPDEQGLALDGWAAVKYLLDQGFDPDNILIMGHSMGGAVATLTAGLVQEEYPEIEVKLINWNSFFSFASAAKHIVSHQVPCCGIQKVLCHAVYWALRALDNIDVTASMEKVKRKAILWNPSDETIYLPAQMIQYVNEGYSLEMENLNTSSEHDRLFKRSELLAIRMLTLKLFDYPPIPDRGSRRCESVCYGKKSCQRRCAGI